MNYNRQANKGLRLKQTPLSVWVYNITTCVNKPADLLTDPQWISYNTWSHILIYSLQIELVL